MEISIPKKYKKLYVVGDIHGEFRELVWRLVCVWEIKDAVVMIAGDCGFGFEKPGYYDDLYYGKLEKRLQDSGIMILCVRGNHDDPGYFNGTRPINYEFLKTLADYDTVKFQDQTVLCLGGAVSTDQEWRIAENADLERLGSDKRVWWPAEVPVKLGDPGIQKLPGHIYAVVSHEAPISMMPVLARGARGVASGEVWTDILDSREYLEKILWRCRPERWYYGHYHESFTGTNGVTQWKGLGIMEISEVPISEAEKIIKEDE